MINTSDDKPLFSVITVCFNSEKTIEQTIKSVINQNCNRVEYIIIDGSSTDRTLEIIDKYREHIDCIVSEPDQGIYDAMNKGISKATGQVISFLNSDDWYEPDTLEIIQEEYLHSEQKTVFHGLCRYIDGEKEGMIHAYHHDILPEQSIAHPTCFVPATLFNLYGTFDTNYRISADYDFLLRLYSNNVQFKRIEKVLVNFRTDGASNDLSSEYENLKIRLQNNQINKLSYLRKTFFFRLYHLWHILFIRSYQKLILGK